jgi:hypothetical protein
MNSPAYHILNNTPWRHLATLVVAASLMVIGFPRQAPAVQRLVLKSESQLKTEAAAYDAAIREITRVASMELATLEDLKKADAILARQIPNLKYNRSKLVVLGLSDAGFTSAVKERIPDSRAAEEFARTINKDPRAILNLKGATSVRDRMLARLNSDTTLLRRVADRLKKAAADIKAKLKTHHLAAASAAIPRLDLETPVVPQPFDSDVFLLIAVAVIVEPPLVLALPAIGAVLIIARLVENIGTDEGKDKVAACQEEADRRYRNCVAASANLPFGANVLAQSACYAQWLLDSAGCLLAE